MTAKGEARRAALVGAAAALVLEQGFGALSHRAVAARAGLPLAATTYYFATLDELRVQAAEHLGGRLLAEAAERAGRQRTGPVGAGGAARRVVELVLPPELQGPALLTAYERYLEAGRTPSLRPVVTRGNVEVRRLLADVLRRSGHDADPRLVLALVDGLAVTALAEGEDPRRAATTGLTQLLARGASGVGGRA